MSTHHHSCSSYHTIISPSHLIMPSYNSRRQDNKFLSTAAHITAVHNVEHNTKYAVLGSMHLRASDVHGTSTSQYRNLAAQAEHSRARAGSQLTDHSARDHRIRRKHSRGHWQPTAHNNMNAGKDDYTTKNCKKLAQHTRAAHGCTNFSARGLTADYPQ